MNTFSFTVNKKTTNAPVSNKSNASTYIDNVIVSNLKKAIPYAFYTSKREDYKPTKNIDIDITVKRNKKKHILDIIPDLIEYNNVEKAIKRLAAWYDTEEDSFDFILPDGTPVKIFDDEIQIGYELIPLKAFSKKYYNGLSEKAKKNIISLTINLNR